MIASGKLSLGEACAPYTLTHVKVVEGKVVKSTSVVHGRRMPLVDVRQKLLDKHETFMHLLSDDAIASLTDSDVRTLLESLHEPIADRDIGASELQEHLCKLHGYILVTDSTGCLRSGCVHE